MKTIAVTVLLVAFTYAEPPPSNSYLPPPSSSRGAGYPQGPASQNFGPQIIAARNLDGAQGRAGLGPHAHSGHGAQANGFGRSAQDHGATAHARHGAEEPAGYPNSAARNALEEINSEGTDFGHHEERQDERAQGEYHVVLPDGRKQTVSYEADERGFKPQISYEDSEDLGRSGGYDNNANNARSNQANGYSNHGNHGNDNGYHGNGNARANGY
ncbi:pro-resilin-like isoform X2 [Spodoptera litura]|uniref:Pro-resilin-like isoform X2 n=1 Tax=Spodoptera litura TaxID=69820 RepID=A0A9J7ECP9_SPOLT|nr:pro-resilin-like isoform X2 [Spodoptera litura]